MTGRVGLAACLAVTGCVWPSWADFASWPVDADGYEIETLPVLLTASFARGEDVYWGLATGEILRGLDGDLSQARTSLGQPFPSGPRLLFVSRSGAAFVSADGQPVYRSSDNGQSWPIVLGVSVWRMDEDDESSLYAGSYTQDAEHVATIYKSTNDGVTWQVAFRDETNDHVHTVRWDPYARRLYAALGDGRPNHGTRGQIYSDDRGATWHDLVRGPSEGHTDAGFTPDFIFWASDDQTGRVFRVHRADGTIDTLMGFSQFMWFAVADGEQIYIGTMPSRASGGEHAALLASHDQGITWQKVLQASTSAGPYLQGFFAESRRLSARGWLYVTGAADGQLSYRVRRAARQP